jgi:endogenous inhibitor of DNA gyrase (YacG/DUF329 family)
VSDERCARCSKPVQRHRHEVRASSRFFCSIPCRSVWISEFFNG